jgi:hydrogenase nickel incorporation protein HypA/HybF
MHELAVTQSVLEITLRRASEEGASRVTDLYLVVGDLSSIVDDSVQFYWDIIAADTLAAGAALHFRRVPVEFECTACGRHYAPSPEQWACPGCGALAPRVVAGEEFYVEAMDIEREPDVHLDILSEGDSL